MARIKHGEVASLDRAQSVVQDFKDKSAEIGMAAAPLRDAWLTRFDYMLPQLQTAAALLGTDEDMVKNLIRLGQSMNDTVEDPAYDSVVPAAYTYFGQFVAHDITLELQSDKIKDLNDSKLTPFSQEFIRSSIKNRRSPTLDLDCVYGATSDGSPVPRVGDNLSVGSASNSGDRPPDANNFNDVPRKPRSKDRKTDREALIGDARNDQNLILAQFHVAFLRAHNALVNTNGMTFNEAKATLTQHYQWLIIDGFLRRIGDNEIINDILTHGNRFYRPDIRDPYMPLEFSAAAFRFGHSMVRSSYDYNLNFMGENRATLLRLFDLTSFSGELDSFDNIPEKWIIEWKRFLDSGTNFARCIDTQLVDPLTKLQNEMGVKMDGVNCSLAARNLLRGYLLRVPIGQEVAKVLGFQPLTKEEILAVARSPLQAEVLQTTDFATRTPLWYYILAEASSRHCLGPVGTTLVAEVLIGLIRWTEGSILCQRNWKPTLGAIPGRFTLKDFFRLASVWT